MCLPRTASASYTGEGSSRSILSRDLKKRRIGVGRSIWIIKSRAALRKPHGGDSRVVPSDVTSTARFQVWGGGRPPCNHAPPRRMTDTTVARTHICCVATTTHCVITTPMQRVRNARRDVITAQEGGAQLEMGPSVCRDGLLPSSMTLRGYCK